MSSDVIKYAAKDYKQAFQMLEPLHKNYIKMLKTHYDAPDRTITVTEIADAVGYQNYSSVNLHYGKIADRVCEALNILETARPDPRLSILVTFSKPKFDHWQLTMRPEVAAALKQLGWV